MTEAQNPRKQYIQAKNYEAKKYGDKGYEDKSKAIKY
jgi:hypothetical protein